MSVTQRMTRAKHPINAVAGPYGHPFHPIAVTLPIGAWVMSVIFDIVALAAEDGEAFAVGATTLVGIGLIGAVIAAILGLLDLTRLDAGTPARRTALTHMTLNLTATVLFAVSLIIRLIDGPEEENVPAFIISVVALLIVGFSGWLGGKLAYRYGVRVASEDTQAEGFTLPTKR